VAFQNNGQPQRAWYNSGRDAQAYRARADRLRPLVERNLELIRAGFSPTAYFIDVWSSLAPYDFWTEDGQFVDRSVTRRVWGETFAWIRDYLGDNAPQISKAGHDRLIGWLDGAQANHLRVDAQGSGFVWNIHCAHAERIPWIDAAYHLTRDGETWRVVAAPDSAAFTARVPWTGPAPTQVTAIDENGAELRQVPIRREGATLILAFDPKTFAYELR
jgi:hypothetical protein